MPSPSPTTPYLGQAFIQVMGQFGGTRVNAIDALATLQSGPVSSDWIFNMVNALTDAIGRFDRFSAVAGLDAHTMAQCPGYTDSMTAAISATRAALVSCRDWIVAAFPKDTTATWLLAYQMAADGSRTPRNFSSAQTAGLQTRLQALIATIG